MTDKLELRYRSLDHWRGVAALAVVLFHGFGGVRLAGQSVHPSIQWLKWLCDFGGFGVHLFFVISGYCIAANVYRLMQHRLGPWDFLRDRLLRIYPTYWGACVFVLIIMFIGMPFSHTSHVQILPSSLLTAAANVMLIEPYVGADPFLLVSWSLVYELGFYILVALGFRLVRAGMKFSWALVVAVALAVLGLFGPWKGALFVLNLWPEFLSGGIVFLALWLNARGVAQPPSAVFIPAVTQPPSAVLDPQQAGAHIPLFPSGIASARLLLLVPIALAVIGLFTHSDAERIGSGVGAALFALALYGLHPFDQKIAAWRPLAWLAWVGTFSYSLYLVHVSFGRILNLGTRVIAPESVWFIFLVMVYWIVAIAGAWVFYKLCEAPLERWRHSLRRKR